MAIARYGFEPKHGGYRNEDSDNESDTESDDSDGNFDSKSKNKLDLKNKPRNKLSENYKWVALLKLYINQTIKKYTYYV
jgi:hypothetical protein